eukprot:jgi/Mesvir1/3626/Mv04363-RA.1
MASGSEAIREEPLILTSVELESAQDKEDIAALSRRTMDAEEHQKEIPECNCGRPAVVKTVIGANNPNKGCRYWACADHQLPFYMRAKKQGTKKHGGSEQGGASSLEDRAGCRMFRWIDPPRLTGAEKKAKAKERLRERELALLE